MPSENLHVWKNRLILQSNSVSIIKEAKKIDKLLVFSLSQEPFYTPRIWQYFLVLYRVEAFVA